MSIAIDIVIGLVQGIIKWVEANKKCQEKIEGVVVLVKAINQALVSFQPKKKTSPAIAEILQVTHQVMRDIKSLLDQVEQGAKKWLFSPDSYYSKLTKKESELSAIIPVLSLAFNIALYHTSEEIQAALSAKPATANQPISVPVQVMYFQPISPSNNVQYVPTVSTVASPSDKKSTPAPTAAAGGKDSKVPEAPKVKMISTPLADSLLKGDARDFWKNEFKLSLTTTTAKLVTAVETKFGKFDAKSKDAFVMAVDHNKDEVITIYEYAKFAVPSLAEAVAAVKTVPDVKPFDPKNLPICDVLWCDPHPESAENKKLVADAKAAGSTVLIVPTAKDGIEFLKVNPDLMFVEKFRVMSANAIYTDSDKKLSAQEVLDAKMSAAEDIIRFLRQKRSFTPVQIYCNFTFPQAEKISGLYSVTKATKDAKVALAFASGLPQAWIEEAQKDA